MIEETNLDIEDSIIHTKVWEIIKNFAFDPNMVATKENMTKIDTVIDLWLDAQGSNLNKVDIIKVIQQFAIVLITWDCYKEAAKLSQFIDFIIE